MNRVFIIIIGALVVIGSLWHFGIFQANHIDFNKEVRPILNEKCMVCHGGVKQEGGLSFLFREDALTPAKSGKTAIIPGQPMRSEVIKRITHHDPEMRMPYDADPLMQHEIDILKRWIKEGAKWEDHWAYKKVEKPRLPACSSEDCQQSIDHFVFQKLQEINLKPAPPADKNTLIRRVSLDLLGLPPSPEMVNGYLKDTSSEAFGKVVDDLLTSQHFGEKWASMWLDLARYADSKGYQKDLLRPEMWRYRDWVIHAFNSDMPFDEFTIQQLAGDLRPNATEEEILATAFHRNTMSNDEGGTDDEEFRVTAVIDRVNTTMEVWQATTMACVQCHSHPYDPIRHEDYYELMAYFNNTADKDDYRDSPLKSLYSPAQKQARSDWKSLLDEMQLRGDTLSENYNQTLSEYMNCMPGNIPIMEELPADSSRSTFIFVKGNWLVHGDTVSHSVPDHLPQLESSFSADRLGLANWMVHPDNPLTARVIVNRIWEQVFGRGLVTTTEDFGTQGAPPSHPELLDWLAHSFVHQHNWQIKPFLKDIVLSATYQMSPVVSPESMAIDPENKFLSRASRYRLSAEQIRDQALVVSGLLNREVYGKSVMPYQPEGVWNVIRHAARWTVSEGRDKYRRGIYTFWRRVSPYPSMMTFDTPSRELCVSRRIRTNTPLQALVLLNDPVFVEAAESLASRMSAINGSISDQLSYGFQLALMRSPDQDQLATLQRLYNQSLQIIKEENSKSIIKTESTLQQLAMTQVASSILNLDEFISRT